MKLLLLRHGPAGDKKAWAASGKRDADRPLTGKGRVKTRLAAAGLRRAAPRVDLMLSSPMLRASQTAAIAAREIGISFELSVPLSQGVSPARVLPVLAKLPPAATVALVGHEPGLGMLASRLTGAKLELKKAGACLISFDGAAKAGQGTLLWLLPPRQLRRLGR